MKLRIKGNSLRVRLTRTEVLRLAEGGSVESETDFGNQAFRYGVIARSNEPAISAFCESNSILVRVPASAAAKWADGNEIGLYGEQPTSTGDVLTIAVEKDFRCLDPRRDEDESDHFDNPTAVQGHHPACAHESD